MKEQLPCWLYVQKGNDVLSLIVKTPEDYELLISQGYSDNPRNCKEVVKEEINKPSIKEPLPVKEEEEISVSELHKDDDEFDLMTKEQLVEYAKENFNKELKVRDTKVSLINEIKALKEG